MTGSLLHDYIGFCLIINALSKLRILPFPFLCIRAGKSSAKKFMLFCGVNIDCETSIGKNPYLPTALAGRKSSDDFL